MRKLTRRQLEALKAIDRLTVPRGPTFRELAEELGMRYVPDARSMVLTLQGKGLIRRGPPFSHRGVRLNNAGEAELYARIESEET